MPANGMTLNCEPRTFWTAEAITRLLVRESVRMMAPHHSRVGTSPDLRRSVTGVSIDTRTLQPGDAFFAIRGERFDGHDYVQAALDAGAGLVVVDREVDAAGPVLLVEDTVAALQRLASAWRDVLAEQGCTVIGVAGSNGKTTTRHMIHSVLQGGERRGVSARSSASSQQPGARRPGSPRRLAGTQSPKSFNNHLGVPLTLLAARAEHDFVVVEIGTNHPGEVATLSALVRPDIAVITSIGEEHLEFFGSVDNVAKEQASLLEYIQRNGVTLIDATSRGVIAKHLPMGADVAWIDGDATVPANLPLPGEHNRRNAALAAAVARRLGVSDAAIRGSLAAVTPVEGRGQAIHFGGDGEPSVTVIHDAYNANPSSMEQALSMLAQWPVAAGGRRVAVLGDMLEGGNGSEAAHERVGQLIRGIEIDTVIFIGPSMASAGRRGYGRDGVAYPHWSDELPAQVAALIEPGDVVLLKASRGMKLERLLPAIEAKFGGG